MYPPFVEQRVREALTDTRVVLLCGPRQSGKTTLARRIASETIPFFTLDDATVLDAAQGRYPSSKTEPQPQGCPTDANAIGKVQETCASRGAKGAGRDRGRKGPHDIA